MLTTRRIIASVKKEEMSFFETTVVERLSRAGRPIRACYERGRALPDAQGWDANFDWVTSKQERKKQAAGQLEQQIHRADFSPRHKKGREMIVFTLLVATTPRVCLQRQGSTVQQRKTTSGESKQKATKQNSQDHIRRQKGPPQPRCS